MDAEDLIRCATGAARDHVQQETGVSAVFIGLPDNGGEPVTCWTDEPLPADETAKCAWGTLRDEGCCRRVAIRLHHCGGAALATLYADDGEEEASAAVQVERDGSVTHVPTSAAAQ